MPQLRDKPLPRGILRVGETGRRPGQRAERGGMTDEILRRKKVHEIHAEVPRKPHKVHYPMDGVFRNGHFEIEPGILLSRLLSESHQMPDPFDGFLPAYRPLHNGVVERLIPFHADSDEHEAVLPEVPRCEVNVDLRNFFVYQNGVGHDVGVVFPACVTNYFGEVLTDQRLAAGERDETVLRELVDRLLDIVGFVFADRSDRFDFALTMMSRYRRKLHRRLQ